MVDPKLARTIEDVGFPSDAVAPDQIAAYVKNEKKKLPSEEKRNRTLWKKRQNTFARKSELVWIQQ